MFNSGRRIRLAGRWAGLLIIVALASGCLSSALAARDDYNAALAQQAATYAEEGDSLFNEGRYDEAIESYDRALEIDPQLQAVWYQRGECYRLKGDYEAAIGDFGQSLEIEPRYLQALASRGESYRAVGRYDEALADLDEAIRQDPDYGWAHASRGETHRQLEDYEQAVADFSEAISRNPDYPWALGRRGESYRMLGDFGPAIADLDRTIELWPDDPYAYASRGETHRQLGEYAAAIVDLERAIELDPDYQWAIERRDDVVAEMEGQTTGGGEVSEPAGAPAPPVARSALPLVAVLDFRVENLPAADGKLIVDLLSSALIGTRRFRVLDRGQQENILKEIEFSYSGCVDERCQLQIGRMLAAEKIVVGSLGRVGGRYILNVRLLQVESGEALASSYQVFASLEDLVDGCPAVAFALSEE
jgi:tetratricopeptide (TPR) repeat protein